MEFPLWKTTKEEWKQTDLIDCIVAGTANTASTTKLYIIDNQCLFCYAELENLKSSNLDELSHLFM